MKILVTTLAIALTIGTAIAALHPPGESVREDKPPARSFFVVGPAPVGWTPPAAPVVPWPQPSNEMSQPVTFDLVKPVMPITPTPVKTETIQGTATDPIYARYQKIWTFPVPDRAGNARGLTEPPRR
jgi:hypothetical protein